MVRPTLEPVDVHAVPSAVASTGKRAIRGSDNRVPPADRKKIWVDLDNSPHVPLFVPIIEELEKRGHEVLLTARDSYQVCELVEFHRLSCKIIGRHWGKNLILKTFGTLWRAANMMPFLLKEKPDLAVSHGSRVQVLCGTLLRIPTVLMLDYEFSVRTGALHPDWIFIPESIPESRSLVAKKQVVRYPGLKEDVYVPRLRPDPSVKKQLGLYGNHLVVTVRPPATEAHYHNAESETLFEAAMNLLIQRPDVRVVLLPRNERQRQALRRIWGGWIDKRKVIIPDRVVDGLNLISFSDLVISGGGTMNREAAALGVPVYSIFRGKIGAVDQNLAAAGRLMLLESVEDVHNKIILERRYPASLNLKRDSPTLRWIADGIASIAERQCLPAQS